jgi:alpha-L-rhamnosidase
MRSEFAVPPDVPGNATLRLSGLGCNIPYLNSVQPLSPEVLGPPWSRYETRVLFRTYAVSLAPGERNCIGVALGSCHYSTNWYDGVFRGALWAELQVVASNGTSYAIPLVWRGASGPVVSATLYGGEVYNVDAEVDGWQLPGFDDAQWTLAPALTPLHAPRGALEEYTFSGEEVLQELHPVASYRYRTAAAQDGAAAADGDGGDNATTVLYDFGTNFAGVAAVLLPSSPGPFSIEIRFGELMWPNHTLNPSTNGLAANMDRVYGTIHASGGVYGRASNASDHGSARWWHPQFTFHGGRYVAVTGGVEDGVVGLVIGNNVSRTLSFHSNNSVLNAVMQAAEASQRSNLHGIPTDCPQRDERLGWLADAQVSATLPFFNTSGLFASFLREIVVSQREAPLSSALIDFVPDCDAEDGVFEIVCNRSYARPADPSWSAAYPNILWAIYTQTGGASSSASLRLLQEHWDPLVAYVKQLQSMAEADGLLTWGKLGDWYATAICDQQVVSGFQQHAMLRLVSKVAAALGRADPFANASSLVAQLFAARYIRQDGSMVTGTGEMCAQAIALEAGLVPPALVAAVQQRLVENVRLGNAWPNGTRAYEGRSVCGVIGTAALFDALCNAGACQMALDAIVTPEYPSFGFMIANGATTLWETWSNACADVDQPCDTEDSSRNHVMLASVANAVVRHMGGLRYGGGDDDDSDDDNNDDDGGGGGGGGATHHRAWVVLPRLALEARTSLVTPLGTLEFEYDARRWSLVVPTGMVASVVGACDRCRAACGVKLASGTHTFHFDDY